METKEGMLEYCKTICEKNNYILNKDQQTLDDLIEGLVDNKKNYGYQSCPCRLASGNRELDRDLICPCVYAPADVEEYGACYCNLYMRPDFYETHDEKYMNVPERRPVEKEKAALDYINDQM
ncbi:MAG: ferredoxin:thioredoxin reductase [Candidatus Lokiarchaeota archaeon]|nr:ferredoxin:thioredoxin reductase [Candidatus Lokiarchaeota archaeon]MBD3338515.1 ferredoxin:thioredoxin reductase [Candidatus Lokiarchaeota archaeon]